MCTQKSLSVYFSQLEMSPSLFSIPNKGVGPLTQNNMRVQIIGTISPKKVAESYLTYMITDILCECIYSCVQN